MLFGHTADTPLDKWVIEVEEYLSPGKVYMTALNPKASELVISEDRKVRSIPLQPGGEYPVEIYSWLTFEEHDNKGFVEIETVEAP